LLFASYAHATNTAPPQVAAFTYVPLIPGRSLANGRFTVRLALSKGGMGAIYLASDNEAFDRLVVVKAMLDYFDPADTVAVQEAHARFLQEARTLSGLRHPAIPQIFTYFQDGPHNYIVMEYIEGHDLEQLLTRRDDASGQVINGHAYPQSNVLRWGVALCQVLGYLASRQPHAVVHHDIKPANLLLDSSSDAIRLVDFGTAKTRLFALSGSVGLQQSSVHGTHGYAAPEQYRGQSEPRSDVYALAATLYHLATDDDPRAHPFDFPQLAQLGSFGQALRAALDVDPSQRPTAAQLQRQLELLAMPTSARSIQAPDGTNLADIDSLVAWCEQHWRKGAAWLYDQLPSQIELWWGQTKLAHDLHAIVKRYSHDTSAGLDAMLALLDPSGFGTQQQQIDTDQPRLDFGTLASKAQPERTMTLSNPGRRYVHADIKLPNWVLTPRTTIRLPPGEQLDIQLIIDQPRANKRGILNEDILLQDGTTTLLHVEAHATVARWRRIWQCRILLAAVLVIGIAVASMNSHDWNRAIFEFEQLIGTYYDDAVLLRQSYDNGTTVALQRYDWPTARAYMERMLEYSDNRTLRREMYILEARQAGALLLLDANALRATFGPDNRLQITPDSDTLFEIRHGADGTLLRTSNHRHIIPVLDVAWSPDGQMLASSYENGLIQFTRTENDTVLQMFAGRAGNGKGLQWSHDGRTLASYGLDVVELWRADGTLLQTLSVNQVGIGVVSVVFSDDDRVLATGSADGSIKLWQASDGKLLTEIERQTNGVQQMIFRDQGRVLVTIDREVDRGAQLSFWRVSDGLLLNTTKLQERPAEISVFSPDGQMIATDSKPASRTDYNPFGLPAMGQAYQVIVRRVDDGYILKRFSLLHSSAQSVSFSADSKQLMFVYGANMLTINRVTSDE
jgi:WD40 repeat protein/tRNA A-37 threonylcarbamoyl transferase component Bud32